MKSLLSVITAVALLAPLAWAEEAAAPAPSAAVEAPATAETVESLRADVATACTAAKGGDEKAKGECDCFIKNVETEFKADEMNMLKILKSGLNPGDVKEIAALLGMSESDTTDFIKMASDKMNKIAETCKAK